ncbi:hypothetical protein TrCOL_g7386 [Triparma columacea]|uniref:C2H2-type domain-containing protein n=1 Tax=Triparma columacea TaxID=722753 RepID=A0A9W7GD63_9STRA|nr:hypothetical protein TrCOL_g7386 [Triparma columacea]
MTSTASSSTTHYYTPPTPTNNNTITKFSFSVSPPDLPDHPCSFILNDESKKPLACVVFLPAPDLSSIRDSSVSTVVGKKASRSKKKKSKMLSGNPWMGAKVLDAAYQCHVDQVVKAILPSPSVPVSLYAGSRFGVTFDASPPPGVTWTVTTSSFLPISFDSLLPTKEDLDDMKRAILADETLPKSDVFKSICSTFASRLAPPPISALPSPPLPIFTFEVKDFKVMNPPIPPPPYPFGLSCMACGRSFNHLKASLDHYSRKHSTTALPQEPDAVWGSHHPLSFQPKCKPPPPPAPDMPPLKVAYIDSTIAIVVKPQGIPVQGGDNPLCRMDLLLDVSYKNPLSGSKHHNWLDEDDYETGVIGQITRTPSVSCDPPSDAPPKPAPYDALSDALVKARPCHRIDSATGGLLVCARTKKASSLVPQLFATGDKDMIQKRYTAIVFGDIKSDEGEVNEPCDGKKSLSRYRVVSRDPFRDVNFPNITTMTTVDLYPITGRMHQLRKHMLHIGHPILGDRKYARYDKNVAYGEFHELMCLWAVEVDFRHPFTNDKVKVAIPEPELYQSLRNSHRDESEAKRLKLS